MLKTNVKLASKVKISPWRKSALGTWKVVGDSQIYSICSVNAEPLLNYLEKEPGISITHFMGALFGKLIAKYPQINRLERFGRIYQREDVSIFFQVASDSKGEDLAGYTVRNADTKSPKMIAEEMSKSVKQIKAGNDVDYKKVKNSLAIIPGILMGPILSFLKFFLYQLNLWSPLIGSPRDSFGSMMITNIGSLGMQTAWAPLVPWSQVPLILTLGKVYEKPVVVDGQVVVQKTIDCCFTTDHRIIDGLLGSRMEKEFIKYFTNPESVLH